ncbi:methyltransferase domain-containing protein [Vogesella sp. LIG4]|uniref:methyltransferase domain-containing protein n=1 Tax=Vogesella sp. LIG4 TaxID=1192162 RepID=UPI00081FA6CE|nr:methyltransferase domain-containing protein [Vogesella sp. LIG4]SCK25921.1 Predicted methyltransferase, contains TPR repeat [Vogesella sp. LIG4]
MSATESLFQSAQRQHLAGDLAAAEALYRQHLAANPDDAAGQHWLGCALHQQGRDAEALPWLQQAVQADSTPAAWWFSLGIVSASLQHYADAVAAFRAALARDAGQYFFWTNLGASEAALGNAEQAEQAWLQALQLKPDMPDAWFLLSAHHAANGEAALAQQCNYRGIVCEGVSKHPPATLAQALAETGQPEAAQALLRQWLVQQPDNAIAQHLLAACGGSDTPARCSDAYVQQAFDQFSASFERKLGELDYQGPAMVAALAAEQGWPQAGWRIADLGCGTGLIGSVLQPHASRLVGVDLSAGMLREAQAKGIYQQLEQAELGSWLATQPERFDLAVCMDTFIYIGELSAVLPAIARSLRPGGQLVFSSELLAGDAAGFHLNSSGRYSHAPAYLAAQLAAAGFARWQSRPVILRQESGVPMRGELYSAWLAA